MAAAPPPGSGAQGDPREPVALLLRDLRTSLDGLTSREAERRLVSHGPNELQRRGGSSWLGQIARQLVHPLALLLWTAAVLALVAGTPVLAAAVAAVVVLNALFAFVQERQAERAVEALRLYLPHEASVRRDRRRVHVPVMELVPGDLLILEEGDGVPADARLVEGALDVDASTLTGESQPVFRSAEAGGGTGSLLEARDLVFSGTSVVGGSALAVVVATGMGTELGRIAALSERVAAEPSPLERQVRRVAWLIAVVAVVAGVAFLPIGWLAAGLPLRGAFSFAIGLIVANVPEGLLPTITLALALGAGQLARRGALVKRLSAVETLGSTAVICTDKTGTLTENRMRAVRIWTTAAELGEDELERVAASGLSTQLGALSFAVAACSNAELGQKRADKSRGEATEVGLLEAAFALGADVSAARRERHRRTVFRFDPTIRLMSTVDSDSGRLVANTKGAPEDVLARSSRILGSGGEEPLTPATRSEIADVVERYAADGLRVLAVARRTIGGSAVPARREDVERDLVFLGVIALYDPPRPEVADAVARCHTAGIRVIVVTGDHGATAAAIARRVGIGNEPVVITGAELDELSESQLDRLLGERAELVFARTSPEAKLRIADALRADGQVVAMTGDGVNDAPALRRADIGIAMGRSGTEVAREAATMILTDDNFSTIVSAVEAGRQVFENVRKFILYIFAHATPEVVPFLVFALSGGAIPLPLTVLQILAIDLGTEILPALALGREAAEPGLMDRPPRPPGEPVIRRSLLVRAWVLLGLVEAGLVLGGFLFVLLRAGWHPGDDVSSGRPLHDVYLQATTMSFAGIVACQVGTAVAARTDHASLRSIGIFSNRLLLWGIGLELVFSAALVYVPALQDVFGTASLDRWCLLFLLPFPILVWGVDELRRFLLRRGQGPPPATAHR